MKTAMIYFYLGQCQMQVPLEAPLYLVTEGFNVHRYSTPVHADRLNFTFSFTLNPFCAISYFRILVSYYISKLV